MSAEPEVCKEEDRDILAGRIDVLYALGRYYLSLPFAALAVSATLFSGAQLTILPFLPLVLLIVTAVVAEQLTQAYKHRAPGTSPEYWAWRYTFVSAIAGASWGVGVFFWFVEGSFAAQAYLCLAYMGMTATEFIARSAHRRAYLAHAFFSLGPLIVMLLIEGSAYSYMTAVLVACFAAVLASYCNGMAQLLNESIRLRSENRDLVEKLSLEKTDAEAARDAAEAGAKAKSIFIANISHELRTPLNALLGMAQLLDRADLAKPDGDHVRMMLESGRGLQTLLDDVIALTQDDSIRASDKDCDPVQSARAVTRLCQPMAWQKGLRLTVTAGASVPHAAADPRRVRQALLKLTDNALKFTDNGGVEIRVDAFAKDGADFVRFAVIDTGLGVPEEIEPRLFSPFSPGDSSYARREQGAGLGLAVVKRIIDAAGGEIGFDSEPGEGSTFWFAVPAVGPAERNAPAPNELEVAPPSGLRLLVFVTDEGASTQIAHALEPFGNTLVFARSAADAVAQAGRDDFDVIIVVAHDADTLAAAPSVKSPVLALLAPGDRAPVCAAELLRTPVDAHQLYRALDYIGAAGRAVEPARHETTAAIDAAAFAALEKSVGPTTLIEILKSYIETTEHLCRALSAASDEANWQQAARFAQDIAGSSSGLGLLAMTAAARGFAAAARQGAGPQVLRNDAQKIVVEQERVRGALANLYPDLVA